MEKTEQEERHLINAFMGRDNNIPLASQNYSGDWNCLMPVVEKIEQVLSVPNASKTKGWDHWNNVFDGRLDTDIKVAYACVVEFIKWYNSQPPRV